MDNMKKKHIGNIKIIEFMSIVPTEQDALLFTLDE